MTNESLKYQSGESAAKRFKDFTRAIIAVPKSEINAAAKKLPPQKTKTQPVKKPKAA